MRFSISHPADAVLLSVSIVAMMLGSVHSFSVFLTPLEDAFQTSRSSVSLTYSLALASLTLAVFFGHRVFSRWSAAHLISVICLLASMGTLVSAFAPTLAYIWLGYGLLFGVANGLGYAFGLQIAAQFNPGREGISMGIVTASYASGSAISPAIFTWAMSVGGFRSAMLVLSAGLLIGGYICVQLLNRVNARFKGPRPEEMKGTVLVRQYMLLWIGYGTAVAGGLIVLGHAAEISKTHGFSVAHWVTPAMVSICGMVGSFAGGWLADHINSVKLLTYLPVISATALIILALQSNIVLLLLCLGMIGLIYGAIVAAYPATITQMFGIGNSPRIYGRIFTAWGVAGFLGPWMAGFLFDQTGTYSTTFFVAIGLGLFSSLAIVFHDSTVKLH